MTIGMGGVIAAAVILLIWAVSVYNSLVGIRNHCDEAWNNIDTELRRRYDLIPKLVNAVKGYMKHEKGLLTELTKAREVCAANNGTPAQQAATERELGGVLSRLMARFEAYPQLQASANVKQLQDELITTADRIQAAERFYNGNAREMNNRVEKFPGNIVAGMFGFKKREYFDVGISTEKLLDHPEVEL